MILTLASLSDLNKQESYKKRTQQQQTEENSRNLYREYFGDFGGSRPNLP